tara:strand:- start:402 stop:794 length:393 start_codon:yes stop_codon:yes gene_type:complete
MKTSEFKKILKPLIEQTVKEVLLKEGVLSKVVAEVAKGLQQPLLKNQTTSAPVVAERQEAEDYEKQKKERIKRLNESAGIGAEVFNNVKKLTESDSSSPLSGVRSDDAGVDISGIQKLSSGKWKQLAGGK